jgi:anti-sigma factor RsiW
MANPVHNAPGDDVLAAYLDGELDADARKAVETAVAADQATRARLEALKNSNRPYKEAFQLVLDAAPRDRLAAAFGAMAPPRDLAPPRRVWVSAAAIVLFASGVAIGIATDRARGPVAGDAVVAENRVAVAPPPAPVREQAPSAQTAARAPAPPVVLMPQSRVDQGASRAAAGDAAPKATDGLSDPSSFFSLGPPAAAPGSLSAPAVSAAVTPPAVNWRQVVADYTQFTTADTLALMPDNPRLADAVSAYGQKLQLDLTSDKLSVPMASLKDVRLYDYRGRPLVEASYLSDDRTTAVALCILLNGAPDAPLAFEQRNGQNIVFWTTGGRGFMLVSKAPREVLEQIAREVAPRLS